MFILYSGFRVVVLHVDSCEMKHLFEVKCCLRRRKLLTRKNKVRCCNPKSQTSCGGEGSVGTEAGDRLSWGEDTRTRLSEAAAQTPKV